MNNTIIINALTVAVMGVAAAQSNTLNAEPPKSNQSDDLAMEELIVTTRKRVENSQDIPLSVTTVTAQEIQNAGIENTEDVARLTPGFTFTNLLGNESLTPVIRGMSTVIGEPNVGFFIDGVYQSSRTIMNATMSENIARVEVAKGPQSALFGRNTFAGAINVITKEPSDDLSGRVSVSVGNGGHYALRGNLSGAITDDFLYAQLGVMHTNTDGFFENELTGEHLDTKKSSVITGAVSYYPNERSKIIVRAGYDKTRNGDYPLRFLNNNIAVANPTSAPIPPAFQLFSGEIRNFSDGFAVTPGKNNHDNATASLLAEIDLANISITAITGYNELDIENLVDNDYSAASIRLLKQTAQQTEFSQELRFTSDGESPLSWMLGGYYYKFDIDRTNTDAFIDGALDLSAVLQSTPLATILPPGNGTLTDESTESFAVFGSLAYELSKRITATLEGRWTHEDKRVFTIDTNVLTQMSTAFEQSVTFDNFVPRLTLDYALGNDDLLYASAAKAVKTGGFNVIATTGVIEPGERIYSPEESWNYELGWKSTMADGRAQLSVALFHTQWTDQIVRALGSSFAVLNANAGETSITGLEAEFRARLGKNLDLTLNGAYTDSAYDRYTFGALADLGVSPVLDGVRLQYVSDYQAYGSLQYSRPLQSGYVWKTRFDLSHQSNQSVLQTDDAFSGDVTLANLRTGFAKNNWEITVWVDNLFEEDTAAGGVFIPNQGSRYNTALSLIDPRVQPAGFEVFNALSWSRNPREWGVTVRFEF